MLGKIFGIMCLISFLFALFTGNIPALSNAIPDGATDAVELTLSLVGMMCLWCGVMQVMEDAGLIRRLAHLLRPLLRALFPDTAESGGGAEEIAANLSANLLGIGNAATPFALAAMEKMQKSNPDKTIASRDMITLAVLNTVPPSLIPTTLIALRRATGSDAPYAILPPIWIVSFACSLGAALLCRALGSLRKRHE